MKYFMQIFLLMINYTTCIAQNTFSFKGQLYHNRLGALKNISILIDKQYPVVTNDAGVFEVGLPKNTSHIIVALSKSDYSILYPYGGYVIIPRDPYEVPQVIVGNVKENDYLKQYLSIYKLIKDKTPTPDRNLEVLKAKMDSLKKLLIQLNFKEADINTAKEIQRGKDDYLPEISGDLIDYVNKATDLKTAFKYVSDYAFNNVNALQKLVEAITNYNLSYQKLNKQHVNYEQRIADYWQSDSVKVAFGNIIALAIDTIHLQNIFPMQETIAMIREYRNSRNAELKTNTQQKINLQVQKLEMLLPQLDKETNEVLVLLKE